MPHAHYIAFFKRPKDSIFGVFTLTKTIYDDEGEVIGKPVKLLDKVPASSGQQRAVFNLYKQGGLGPIPYGNWYIHCKKDVSRGVKPGAKGIGWFFPVSDSPLETLFRKILNRMDIGVHCDNSIQGSAGCVVLKYWQHFVIFASCMLDAAKSTTTVELRVFE